MLVLMVGLVATTLGNVAIEGLDIGGFWQVTFLAVASIVLGLVWVGLVYGLRPRRLRGSSSSTRWLLPPLEDPVARPALLAELSRLLVDDDASVVGLTTALVGAGGFGKTTLAIQACSQEHVRNHFPGGLFWVTIGQERSGSHLAAIVNDVAEQIEGDRPQFSDPEQAGRHLGQLLTSHPRCLLVIDDVWTPEQLRPFTFGAAHSTRLVTTRIPATLSADTRAVKVDEMDRAESESLLLRGLPERAVPHATIAELLRLTGNWPLLLAIVNGAIHRYVKDGGTPTAAAADLVDRLKAEGPAVFDPSVERARGRAVRLTVGAGLRLLSAEQRTRYLHLGIFAEDAAIPLVILELLWRTAPTDTRKLCEDLADLSLVKSYRRGSPTLQLHDVIRDHLRHELAADLPAVNGLLLDAGRALLPSANTHWWQLPRAQDYLWQQLCYHLAEAGRQDELSTLVLDLRWGEERIVRFGLAAYETDLDRCDSPLAATIKRTLVRKGHLLAPIEPPHSHADLLASRLRDEPQLRDIVAAYESTLPTNVARLSNLWPIPPVDPALLRALTGHLDAVTACVIGASGDWLVTTGADRTVRVWSTATWTELLVLSGHAGTVTGCAVEPGGRWLATTSDDRTVRIWDTRDWSARTSLTSPVGALSCCAFARDGSWLAAGGAKGTQVWSTQDWRPLTTLRGHTGTVTACAAVYDSTWLATTSDDGSARIWETKRWTTVATLQGHVGAVVGCATAPDGSWLATTGVDRTVRIWGSDSWRESTALLGHTESVTGCAVAPDGSWLASTSTDRTVRIWDTDTWSERARMRGHTQSVTGCAVGKDGTWIATTSADHNLRVWDTSSEHRRPANYTLNRPVASCVIAPLVPWLVASGSDAIACVWSIQEPTVLHTLQGHGAEITACAIDPVGRWVATGSADTTVIIWDTETWLEHRSLVDHTDTVTGCAVDSEGTRLVTTSADGRIRVWETASWNLRKVFATSRELACCSFSRDGTWLATAGGDHVVRVWNADRWTLHATLRGHQGTVTRCAFAADGTWLATTSTDGTARIWRTSDWTEVTRLTAHNDVVTSCSVSPDGSWLATTGGDAAVRVWESTTWQPAAAMRTNGMPLDACWLPNSRALCVGAVGGLYKFAFAPPTR
jgi:WD40 repeat protein